MGNVHSVDAGPGRERRTAHKLSKPRTANYATAGLLSPHGVEDPRRRFSSGRTISLPYGTSPAPSPMFPPSETAFSSQAEERKDSRTSRSRSLSRTASALFRSKSSQARPRTQGAGAMPTPPQSALPSRANSMIIGASEAAYYAQARPISLQRAGSRSSVHYNLNSYEAKRLLNLAEESSYENKSVMSGSQVYVSEASGNPPRQSTEFPAAPIARANSDLALYTPMRRRSLMTPGLATRAPTPSLPQKSKARRSLPPTPRRQSLESMGVGMLAIPQPSFASDAVPGAVTPCESDYRQIGAFKLGSLRITNGSPVRSPAVDYLASKGTMPNSTAAERDYFPRKEATSPPNVVTSGFNAATAEFKVQRNLHLSPLSTSFQVSSSGGSTSSPKRTDLGTNLHLSPEYLPEIQVSPFALEASAPSLQTTSKHSAMEDALFEDEQLDFSYSEVLDVRVDLNAKSLPPRPRLISEGRNARDMTRSDSGVVATPISEYSHKSLAKTDSGYSSNVSLRSFSAKPPLPEKDQPCTTEIEIPPRTPAKDIFPTEAVLFPSPKATGSETAIAGSHEEVLPPPVPEKDLRANPARASKELSPTFRQSSRLDQIRASIRTKGLPSPTGNGDSQGNGAHGASKSSPRSPLSPTSSTTSTSALSISSDSRKPGKLQRFLSGARIPLTTHTTHPSEKNGIPPIPKETEAKLHEHAGLFPFSSMKFGPKAQPSRETLGTIFSVGSAEAANFDDDIPPVPSLPKIVALATEDLDDDQVHHGVNLASFRSTLAQATTAVIPTRKPVLRKPVPIRSPTQMTSPATDYVQNDAEMRTVGLASTHNSRGEPNLGAAFLAMADERDMYFAPTKAAQRTQTMTAQVERDLEMHYAAFDPIANSSNDYSSPVLESTLLRLKKTRTPPPVSMRTRNSGILRVPPPLRAQSTPPDATRIRPGLASSRKTSRESIHSYPAAVNPRGQASLSRRSSRENVHSYPPAQDHYQDMQRAMVAAPPVDLGRSLSFVTNSGEHRRPNWEVQTDHGGSSRRASVDHSRRNSVTSQSSQQQSHHGMPGPRPRPHPQFSNPAPPMLRHRSSYDGYSHRQVPVQVDVDDVAQSLIRDNGPYPSMPAANGQAYVSDPWSGRPMPQQFDQQGRYPPHVPRGHSRNRSVGAPYRVLHSYNSPAYKHVPIWG